MTRKRFTKLLMGIGFQRNEAEVFAYWKCKWRKPYADTGELNVEAVLRDLNYLELHKNER